MHTYTNTDHLCHVPNRSSLLANGGMDEEKMHEEKMLKVGGSGRNLLAAGQKDGSSKKLLVGAQGASTRLVSRP